MPGRRAGRRFRWLALPLALVLLFLIPRVWRLILAGLLVASAYRPAGPHLLERVTPASKRTPVEMRNLEGPRRADLYLPGRGDPVRALLLVHGVNATGKDDPRLVALASNLARVRSAVLVPDFPALRRLQVSPADIPSVVHAYEELLRRFDGLCRIDEASACGMMSFSYGAGPSLLAAADPAVRDRVGFVVAFGGYAELTEVVRFVTTGSASDPRVEAAPYPWAKWAFLAANASLVEDQSDRALLRRIARRRLDDRDAGVTRLAGALGPEGAAVYALMTNENPERVERLVAGLSPPVRKAMAALSPLRRVGEIRADLLLAHGIGDRSIPFTESERLAEAAPGRARLTLTRLFGHVDPAAPAARGPIALPQALSDGWRLVLFTDALLSHAR